MGTQNLALTSDLVLGRLLLAVLLGALLGLERERRDRPAGLRTHILVTVTTCLVMLLALHTGNSDNVGRVMQGVLTGIGFLGAGTILRQGEAIRGLTTAGSIWAAAGLGLAVGVGAYVGAVVGAVLVFAALTLLRSVESRLHHDPGSVVIHAQLAAGVTFPAGLLEYLLANGAEPTRLALEPEHPGHVTLEMYAGRLSPEAAVALVNSAPGLQAAELLAAHRRHEL